MQQKPLNKLYWGSEYSQEQPNFKSGEVWITYCWQDTLVSMTKAGLKCAFLQPSQGRLSWICGFMLGAQTKNSDTELTGALGRSAGIGAATGLVATALGIMASIGLSAPRLRLRALIVAVLLLPLVVPFAVLVVLPRLRSLDPSMIEAARDLGSTELTAFSLVTLPLLLPSLVSSFLICFITSFDEFAIASFLAPPGQPTFPVFLYTGSRAPGLLPEFIAIGSLIVVGSLVVIALAEGGRRWAEGRLRGVPAEEAEIPAGPGAPALQI